MKADSLASNQSYDTKQGSLKILLTNYRTQRPSDPVMELQIFVAAFMCTKLGGNEWFCDGLLDFGGIFMPSKFYFKPANLD